MAAVIKVKNEQGNWVDIPAIIGPVGPGVPVGGTEGQLLVKSNDNPYVSEWVTPDFPSTEELAEVADSRIPDALVSVETTPSTNNTINWLYE